MRLYSSLYPLPQTNRPARLSQDPQNALRIELSRQVRVQTLPLQGAWPWCQSEAAFENGNPSSKDCVPMTSTQKRAIPMKYMISWFERSQGSAAEYENAQKRILEIFTQWKAPANFTIELFVVRVGWASVGGLRRSAGSSQVLLDLACF